LTQVTVEPGRTIGYVNRNIFGGFIEHLGRCIYGGIYEEGSPLSDHQGFRTDTLALLKDLQVRVLRWPGGNFVSNYHWQDGVGPKDARPVRSDLAWGGVEPNRFGTDEFMAYCAALGAEPYICLNMGTGTLEEALAWIEYCNSSRATYWTEQRRLNGRDEPYGVMWWGLGNEMWGEWQVGSMSASEYVREASRWAKAIKLLDPGAKLVSCGWNGWDDWDREVIDGMAGLVDLHSLHIYTGSDDYWTNVLQVHQAERAIGCSAALIQRAAYLQKLDRWPRIAYDEWNVWFRTSDGTLEERYSMADALAVATYLNIFVRNCSWVQMANLAQLVNAIAPVVTTPEVAVVQPIYFPLLMHSQTALDLAVEVHVDGPTVAAPYPPPVGRWAHRLADLAPFDIVDASATVDRARRKLSLTIVNRSYEAPEPVKIVLRDLVFGGSARVRTLTSGPSAAPLAVPSVRPTSVDDGSVAPNGSELVISMPPQSFAVVEVTMASQ
jgi:alpha-N-arabinofuranosidase